MYKVQKMKLYLLIVSRFDYYIGVSFAADGERTPFGRKDGFICLFEPFAGYVKSGKAEEKRLERSSCTGDEIGVGAAVKLRYYAEWRIEIGQVGVTPPEECFFGIAEPRIEGGIDGFGHRRCLFLRHGSDVIFEITKDFLFVGEDMQRECE